MLRKDFNTPYPYLTEVVIVSNPVDKICFNIIIAITLGVCPSYRNLTKLDRNKVAKRG